MKPVIALVGRPNVGKSTLFNQLTKSRDALVADMPGLTRDRKYGSGKVGDKPYIVVDTGGLTGEDGIDEVMADQVHQAIGEASIVMFVVDARDGLTAGDEIIAKHLRTFNKDICLVINKSDGVDPLVAVADFSVMGMGEAHTIAAAHGRGVAKLMDYVLADLPDAFEEEEDDGRTKVAIIGRPNVGKSTLVNRLLREERVVAYDMPGTTRDSVFIPFEHEGREYTLIDTAGVRRRGKVKEAIEKFSVIKALQAIEAANVVIMVFDAHEGVTDQDASLAGFVLDAGRAMVLAINKWDGLSGDERERIRSEMSRKLGFLDFAETHFISALHGTGVGHLFESVDEAFECATKDMATPWLTRVLEDAVTAHQPPLVQGRRIKLRYAHQGGKNPPLVVIHGNQTQSVPMAYRRYLVNVFRKVLNLKGTPLRVEFKGGDNPYAGRKNKLTKRQVEKKKRLRGFVKKNKKRRNKGE